MAAEARSGAVCPVAGLHVVGLEAHQPTQELEKPFTDCKSRLEMYPHDLKPAGKPIIFNEYDVRSDYVVYSISSNMASWDSLSFQTFGVAHESEDDAGAVALECVDRFQRCCVTRLSLAGLSFDLLCPWRACSQASPDHPQTAKPETPYLF